MLSTIVSCHQWHSNC